MQGPLNVKFVRCRLMMMEAAGFFETLMHFYLAKATSRAA